MSRILLIEDEDVIRKQLARMLERNRYQVTGAATVEQAIELDCRAFDLILADIRLPGAKGTDIIARADPVPVIMMTSFASVRSAVDSMKLGAVDYISKPFDHDELLLLIERSLQSVQLSAQNAALQRDLQRYLPTLDQLPTQSPVRKLIEQIDARSPHQPLWLYGKQGSGRELIARTAHACGARAAGPLVFADVRGLESAAMMQAQLQRAQGGSIVIRDPQHLDHERQSCLVQMLSSAGRNAAARTFDIDVIMISVFAPEALITDGTVAPALATFAADYAYRVPGLRERRDDILPLATACIESATDRLGRAPLALSPDASKALLAYDWPGNVSELRNMVERAVLLCDDRLLQASDFGFALQSAAGDLSATQEAMHTCLNLDEYFRFVVLRYQDDVSETELAGMLGISRKALWERRQRMGLNRSRS
jgi:DNA-binding NtrC family response regulator